MSRSFLPLVSIIIIDYKKDNPYLVECLEHITQQTYKNYEIILETDYPKNLNYPKLTIINYQGKHKTPSFKRDHGGKMAKGEILSYIDDDAYPHRTWLENIIDHFRDRSIAGVGGPGITPSGVSWREEASGWASASPVGSGSFGYRFIPGRRQFVDDYPSMNLSVRKDDFLAVGGFDSDYWPGEDTKLCLDLTKKLNKSIIYEPKAKVFHHRRPVMMAHLRQNGNFGLHRGYFARVLPQTSLRPVYFLPSALLVGIMFLIVTSFIDIPIVANIRILGFVSLLFYFFLLLLNSLWIYSRSKNIQQMIISIPIIFVTHLWYGLRFTQGLFFTTHLSR